jgi:cyclin-dependent kinase-like
VLGPLHEDQQESFRKNPRFNGLKFPDVSKPETLEKRYMSSLSKKALTLMSGFL